MHPNHANHPEKPEIYIGWPPPPRIPSVITIGNFDGFHIGHQFVLHRLREYARPHERTVLMTFEPHPAIVAGHPIRRIQSPRQRRRWLETAPVDAVWLVPFSWALLHMEPEAFIESILFDQLDARVLVVGEDFRFGYQRRGDVTMLRDYLAARGGRVIAIEMIRVQDIPCHSTEIRQRLVAGEVEIAARLLGRPFSLDGTVVRGDHRGQQIGYPTANLVWYNGIVPKSGVYATLTRVGQKLYPSITNVGFRPTFGGHRQMVESHLLEAQIDLYGQRMEVYFLHRIRDERPFETLSALRKQIASDIQQCRRILSRWTPVDERTLQPWPAKIDDLEVTLLEGGD